jgi:nicotinamidase-related amidase
VVDVFNDFDHEDGDELHESFAERASNMRQAIDLARAGHVPLIYVNDEQGRWDIGAPARTTGRSRWRSYRGLRRADGDRCT